MIKKNALFLSLVLILPTNIYAKTKYTLKKNQTITQVLDYLGYEPIYYQNGYLSKTLKLNNITSEEAAKLKSGTIIWLPSKSEEESQRNDDVSIANLETKEQVKKEVPPPSLHSSRLPKKYDYVTSSYSGQLIPRWDNSFQLVFYNQEMEVSETIKAKLKNNFGVKTNFKKRITRPNNINQKHVNVYVTAVKNNDLEVEGNQFISGNFSPSFQAGTSFEQTNMREQFTWNPYIDYSYFPSLESKNNQLKIRRDGLLWSGLNLKKDFWVSSHAFFIKADAGIVTWSHYESAFNDTKRVTGQRVGAGLGFQINYEYQLEFTYNKKFLKSNESRDMSQLGLSLGHIF